ncbi:MAG TPA: tRNA (guanosine(46)-N7)-methyltransferase TrmB [Balneolaceae bacterium]|nr:tRNA (guanosine(46)-N7)-methyltransferase TrmB [Balneolaceae bacterium]
MPVNKLQRFAEIEQMDRVLEYTDYFENERAKPKGKWNRDIFKNKNPITLELGCGKARTTTSLAKDYPERNFVGIDIKGARIWKGAKRADKEGLANVRFLRTYIGNLDEYFAENEVAEIWITFPDPWPRSGDRSKRLTSPRFLSIYKKILKPEAVIHFKTDNDDLFEYTLKTAAANNGKILTRCADIYQKRVKDVTGLEVQTSFEKKHLERKKTIKYVKIAMGF